MSERDAARASWAPFPVDSLSDYMRWNLPGFRGPLEVEQFKGGQSNPTFLLTGPEGRYVLRKKPTGTLVASAHAIEREFKVLSALQGTGVPVPRVHCLCENPEVIGTAFYLMDHVPGRTFWDPALPELSKAQRTALYDDINRVVAALHRIDPEAVGLADFGRRGAYLQRQVSRWGKQYLEARGEQPVDALERLMQWLPTCMPAEESVAIVHGDLRLDNLLFHPSEPRVAAVLDWEISTLGDPLADLGFLMLCRHLRPDEFRGMAGADLEALGIPSADEFLARYCARAGRARIPQGTWDFYIVYNLFRLAAILHGIGRRCELGTAADPAARELGSKARPIADIGWRLARERLGAH